jgi:glycosyltransferase involved in cell wall biosynthesis
MVSPVAPGRIGHPTIPLEDRESIHTFKVSRDGNLEAGKDSFKTLVVDGTGIYGGAFEIAYNLVKHGSKLEPRSVALVSSQPFDYLKARVADAFASYYFRPRRKKFVGGSRLWLPWNLSRNLLQRELPAAYRLSRVIRDFGATVVHLNNSLASQMFGVMASRFMGTKCICSHRDYDYPSRILQPLKGYVDRHIVCSKTVKSHLVDVLGIPEAKIAYIYDPVDTDDFNPEVPPADLGSLFGIPPGRKVFAIIGRLVRWKGHEVFLRAARLVVETVPDAHAMIVGDTSDGDLAYGDGLREMSRELGIADRTTFTGYRSDIAPLMRASEVLVHASTMAEPFGTVVMEGMACGRPYVAMDEGGPPEMIESGTHGLLVRPSQPGEMARAIITLLTQPETAATFGSAARSRSLERFSAPTIAKQHLDLYREVAARR